MTIEERTTGLEAKPDISGVESGSMNFGDETFITPPPAGRGIVERATEAGIALEVEAFDVGHVVSAVRWLEQGVLEPPMRINLVFGVPGGIDASPEALDAMLRPLPRGHVLDGHLHRPPPPADAGPRPPQGRARDPHRPRGRRLHQQGRPRALERRARRDGGRARRGRSVARSRPRTRRRSYCTLAEPAAPSPSPPRRAAGARPRDPRGDPRRRDRAVRPARLPRDLDARDRVRGRDPARRDLPLVPVARRRSWSASRTTSWSA